MNTNCAKGEYGRIPVVRLCILFARRRVGNDLWPAHRSLGRMREEQISSVVSTFDVKIEIFLRERLIQR